jgi:hypothetical protein
MKQNNNFRQVFFYFGASIVLMLAMMFSMIEVKPVSAQSSHQGIASTWYVAANGDDANDCKTPGTPCASINGALGKASAGDTIEVASGTYSASGGTEVVLIDRDITLSGGWDETFSAQNGRSSIDGQKLRRGITLNNAISAALDHFNIQNGFNSTQGGGIRSSGSLTLSNVDISANVSGYRGGGIDISNGSVTMNNSTISNNKLVGGSSGSGIYAAGTLTLNNSTVDGNTGGGEGIYINNGALNLYNSTISANQGYGFNNTGGSITLQNTIVAGNGTVGDCSSNGGAVTSHGYNLIGKSGGCGFIANTGDQVGTLAQPIDARLGALFEHGGATPTRALYSDSPALDAGNPAAAGSGGAACLATDQRGVARPSGSACDIGAYEGFVIGVKSITRASSNPTTASSVDFIVTFSEAVTGVDTADFVPTTNGPSGATITAISGSGTTYTVSVNTRFGDGNLRLDVIDDDSILDILGNPLGGPGAGNGNFTTGEIYTMPATWYVATTGDDSVNDCLTSASACASINAALGKATAGDRIKVALGTYTASNGTEVVLINKNITLSGGWKTDFSAQSGKSIIDGQKTRTGMTVNSTTIASVDHFKIQNGYNSTQGGGLQNSGSLSLSDSVISGNVSSRIGGGIYNSGLLTIDSTTISQNSAGSNYYVAYSGSGIYMDGTLTLNNSTISGNTGGNGEGIAINSGSLNINNSTISANQSFGFFNTNGKVTLQNTIVAGNSGSRDCYITTSNHSGTVTSLGYNLIGKSDGCGFSPITGDQVGTIAQPIDARLGTLQDHGGTTQTQALYSDSPALNAGNPAAPGSSGAACLATDQRGVARPQGSACDIGAYEGSIAGVRSITRADPNPTNASNLDFIVTFTEAVSGVDSSDFALTTFRPAGATITAISGSDTTYTVTVNTGLGAGSLRLDVIDDDSILDTAGNSIGGAGAGNGNFTTGEVYTIPSTWFVATSGNDSNDCLTITATCASMNNAMTKASAGDTIKVALGTYSASSGEEVVLINKNLTLSGGWDEGFSAQSGRSIIDGQKTRRGITILQDIYSSIVVTATVDHFKIQNGYNSNFGGGIYNYFGILTINDSIISGNVSSYFGGGIANMGTLTITNTTISGNTAGDSRYYSGGGGGIENYGTATATLNNSTVSNNISVGDVAGGIDTRGNGKLTLNNSTISANTGAGVSIFTNTVTLNNSTISGNQTYGFTNNSGTVTLQNSIIAGNGSSKSDCESTYGTVKSLNYNLIGKMDWCNFTPATGDLAGTSAQPIDARLEPLNDHGGETFTQALYSDSPALNKGNPAIPGSGGGACLAADQRGVTRPVGSRCDIGAYEGSVVAVKSITRVSSNPTAALNVKFTVTFSAPVTGVDMTAPFKDFALATIGPASAAVTSVIGSGAVFIVTVNTGLGADAIRLDVVDDDSIQSVSGDPLGGAGSGNGNFKTGEIYNINSPHIASIRRASSNPIITTSVKYTVTFSEAVTGVDTSAPFKDFALTRSGVIGGAITAVSGSGAVYTVSVAPGTSNGNGTLRLDVIDDDSIRSASGRPLGGAGIGDGNYTAGELYNFLMIATQLGPFGTSFDTTPIYRWSTIPGASQYLYQLWRGNTLIYTQFAVSSACIATKCSSSPLLSVGPAVYRWRIRANVKGAWRDFSPYRAFIIDGPKAGLWQGSWPQFYITPDQKSVKNFSVYISVNGCGNYRITSPLLVPIVNGEFSFGGAYYASGYISTTSHIEGTSVGFSSFYIPGCGSISGGLVGWGADWINASQPSSVTSAGEEPTVIKVAPIPGEILPTFTVDPIKP